jgi:hypothetical protein
MVLTIAALDTAGNVDIWISGRADLRLSFSGESAASFPSILGVCVRIRSGADGDDGDGASDGAGDGDGTEST